MHLYLFCEDLYGKQILPKFLAPFTTKFTRIEVKTYRGVDNLIKDMGDDVVYTLKSDPAAYIFILVDVKGFPEIHFPKSVYQAEKPSLAKYHTIIQQFRSDIAEAFHPRFFVHPTMMELETWILADIQALASYLRVKPDRLTRPFAPEDDVNPTQTLQNLIKTLNSQRSYQKSLSELFFKHLSAQRVYDDNCPAFVRLVDDLLYIQGLKPAAPTPDYPTWPTESPECERLRQEIEARVEALPNDATDAELDEIMTLEKRYESLCS